VRTRRSPKCSGRSLRSRLRPPVAQHPQAARPLVAVVRADEDNRNRLVRVLRFYGSKVLGFERLDGTLESRTLEP
jgi:hypothetical protein